MAEWLLCNSLTAGEGEVLRRADADTPRPAVAGMVVRGSLDQMGHPADHGGLL